MTPALAEASSDKTSALHAYARARLADSEGALGLAVDSYRLALNADPQSIQVAQRSYLQAIESGDMALALRAAALLDDRDLLPRDGTLLMIGNALSREDWRHARLLVERMRTEGNFAFLAPIVESWIALGEGHYAAPVIDPADHFAMLARRYLDEHVALQALAQGDMAVALPASKRAVVRESNLAALRITLAAGLAIGGERKNALSLLPEQVSAYAQARGDIERGKIRTKGKAAFLTPRQGFAHLLTRLAVDISKDGENASLGIRLARIASFCDPASAEVQVALAQLLTMRGHPDFALRELADVPASSWFTPIAQTAKVDALEAAGDQEGALALAQALAAVPGADSEQHVRLGRLLSATKDFSAAAVAFRDAQRPYAPDGAPWVLYLFEGSALEQAGQWDEARVALIKAAQIAPNEPVVLNYLGYAQVERRQNVGEALALIKRASVLKPEDASINDSLGWAQYVSGNAKAAVPVLERAAAGAPGDVTINEHLGDALWTVGRRYEARYAWRAAGVFADGDVAERLAVKAREGLRPEYAAP